MADFEIRNFEFADAGNYEWSKEKLNQLVMMYSTEDVLWDGSHPDYYNRESRAIAMKKISGVIDFPTAAIVKKIRHLRTQYTRELAKAKKVGSQYFQSKWPYFEILDSFLRNHIQSRFLPSPEESSKIEDELNGPSMNVKTNYLNSIINCINAGDCDNNADDCKDCDDGDFDGGDVEELPRNDHISDDDGSDEKASTDTAPRIKISRKTRQDKRSRRKKRGSDVKKSRVQAAPEPGDICKEAAVEKVPSEDPDDVFGRNVTRELRLISNTRTKQFTKLQIHNILFNAQFGLISLPPQITSLEEDSDPTTHSLT